MANQQSKKTNIIILKSARPLHKHLEETIQQGQKYLDLKERFKTVFHKSYEKDAAQNVSESNLTSSKLGKPTLQHDPSMTEYHLKKLILSGNHFPKTTITAKPTANNNILSPTVSSGIKCEEGTLKNYNNKKEPKYFLEEDLIQREAFIKSFFRKKKLRKNKSKNPDKNTTNSPLVDDSNTEAAQKTHRVNLKNIDLGVKLEDINYSTIERFLSETHYPTINNSIFDLIDMSHVLINETLSVNEKKGNSTNVKSKQQLIIGAQPRTLNTRNEYIFLSNWLIKSLASNKANDDGEPGSELKQDLIVFTLALREFIRMERLECLEKAEVLFTWWQYFSCYINNLIQYFDQQIKEINNVHKQHIKNIQQNNMLLVLQLEKKIEQKNANIFSLETNCNENKDKCRTMINRFNDVQRTVANMKLNKEILEDKLGCAQKQIHNLKSNFDIIRERCEKIMPELAPFFTQTEYESTKIEKDFLRLDKEEKEQKKNLNYDTLVLSDIKNVDEISRTLMIDKSTTPPDPIPKYNVETQIPTTILTMIDCQQNTDLSEFVDHTATQTDGHIFKIEDEKIFLPLLEEDSFNTEEAEKLLKGLEFTKINPIFLKFINRWIAHWKLELRESNSRIAQLENDNKGNGLDDEGAGRRYLRQRDPGSLTLINQQQTTEYQTPLRDSPQRIARTLLRLKSKPSFFSDPDFINDDKKSVLPVNEILSESDENNVSIGSFDAETKPPAENAIFTTTHTQAPAESHGMMETHALAETEIFSKKHINPPAQKAAPRQSIKNSDPISFKNNLKKKKTEETEALILSIVNYYYVGDNNPGLKGKSKKKARVMFRAAVFKMIEQLYIYCRDKITLGSTEKNEKFSFIVYTYFELKFSIKETIIKKFQELVFSLRSYESSPKIRLFQLLLACNQTSDVISEKAFLIFFKSLNYICTKTSQDFYHDLSQEKVEVPYLIFIESLKLVSDKISQNLIDIFKSSLENMKFVKEKTKYKYFIDFELAILTIIDKFKQFHDVNVSQTLFMCIDFDGKGFITEEDFCAVMSQITKIQSIITLRAIYDEACSHLDLSQSFGLNAEYFEKIILAYEFEINENLFGDSMCGSVFQNGKTLKENFDPLIQKVRGFLSKKWFFFERALKWIEKKIIAVNLTDVSKIKFLWNLFQIVLIKAQDAQRDKIYLSAELNIISKAISDHLVFQKLLFEIIYQASRNSSKNASPPFYQNLLINFLFSYQTHNYKSHFCHLHTSILVRILSKFFQRLLENPQSASVPFNQKQLINLHFFITSQIPFFVAQIHLFLFKPVPNSSKDTTISLSSLSLLADEPKN